LGKCWEEPIKERALLVLANIDPALCAQVAAGLGLPAPSPTVSLAEPEPSPALSQLGGTWPLDGRIVGIVTAGDQDPTGVRSVRQAVLDAGMVPLVIAPTGGKLDQDGEPIAVQRTFATARSIEFDAILLAGAPAPGADSYGARDAKVDDDTAVGAGIDPRVLLMISEAYRHGKALGAWAGGADALEAAGVAADAPGVVAADSGETALAAISELLARHRAWDRFTPAV
ncbi:catalase HPII, partial [Streptomyces polygonati]